MQFPKTKRKLTNLPIRAIIDARMWIKVDASVDVRVERVERVTNHRRPGAHWSRSMVESRRSISDQPSHIVETRNIEYNLKLTWDPLCHIFPSYTIWYRPIFALHFLVKWLDLLSMGPLPNSIYHVLPVQKLKGVHIRPDISDMRPLKVEIHRSTVSTDGLHSKLLNNYLIFTDIFR